jgi:thiol-disulfide isomerase/thioredoxin
MKNVWVLLGCMLMLGCSTGHKDKITVHLIGGFNRRFSIYLVAVNGQPQVMLDSGRIKGMHDSLTFELPSNLERLIRLSVPEKGINCTFVNDSPDVIVKCYVGKRSCTFFNSPASSLWNNFQEEQSVLRDKQQALSKRLDSLQNTHSSAESRDSTKNAIWALVREVYLRNLHFADTTTSPGLFLIAYNLVDFGKDYQGLEQFMLRAKQRFPNHVVVQRLVAENLEITKIYSHPLQVGDSIPDLVLPDRSGQQFSLYSVRNKYILINFWSTFCSQCKPFMDMEKVLGDSVYGNELVRVSVDMDNLKGKWVQIIDGEDYHWTQLIDEQMWKGEASRLLRVDSIPYTFLVGPDKRILAKGIDADSLVSILPRYIK